MTRNSGNKRVERLKYRSWHRGMREMDLLLGSFADAHLHELTPEQLDQYEMLLELPDPELYKWIIGQEAFPKETSTDITNLLLKYAYKIINENELFLY